MNQLIPLSRNPYCTTNKEPSLIKSLFAFIDILGYTAIVENARKDNSEQEIFRNLYNVLKNERYRLEKSCTNGLDKNIDTIINSLIEINTTKDSFCLRAFTDNIVIGFPENNETHLNFQEVILKLAQFQFEMIKKIFFIRGAISYDFAYIDDIAVFGKALTEAVKGEKDAIYSRVILTESAITIIKKLTDRRQNLAKINLIPYRYIQKYILVDENGKWFINYLEAAFFDYLDYNNNPNIDIISVHKKRVEKNLEEHKGNSDVICKYIWLAHYHNFFCSIHSEHLPKEYKIIINNPYEPEKKHLFSKVSFCR